LGEKVTGNSACHYPNFVEKIGGTLVRFEVVDGFLIPEPLSNRREKLLPISKIQEYRTPDLQPSFIFSPELQDHLQGRKLLLEELPFSLSLIHSHYENGYVSFQKGIVKEKGRFQCNRCGNADQHFFASFHCSRCGETCTYCRKCVMMGRVSECTPLLVWHGPEIEFQPPPVILNWQGQLSSGQQQASDAVVQAVQHPEELLVWAVCGAGKTEVLFHGIEKALSLRKRVCITTPRTDVVLELAPRLKQAFPNIEISALYGGSEDRGKLTPLTISTTHQLLRYYKAFDVMIIDEVDAFPYTVDETLHYAVRQAKKEGAPTIYLTATPNRKWQKEVQQGKRKAVIIPARYHGYPIPVPVFEWCGNWRKHVKNKRLPRNVLQWIKDRLHHKKQAFLFVPHIQLLQEITTILKTLDKRIEGVHAEDPSRKEKVERFRRGDIPLLVTTTILERGVTVPNIDVAVLGAEDRIFTESALVQISGRVGRSASYPSGDIVFFHYGKTKEMLAAKCHIEMMNLKAKRSGLIKL
jgi:competence protein ComFA